MSINLTKKHSKNDHPTMSLDITRAPDADVEVCYNVAGVLKKSLALGRHTVDVTNVSQPCLKVSPECSISGAVSIARYLAETAEGSKLKDGLEDVKILQWLEWAQNSLRPALITLEDKGVPVGILQRTVVQRASLKKKRAATVESLENALAYLQDNMGETAVVGKAMSLADYVVGAYACNALKMLGGESTKTFEKLQKWADNVAPSSRVVDPIVKAKKTLEKVESKLRPKPIVNGMESRIEAVFTKALHKAFPMVSEKVPVAKVTASDRGAEYQCTSAMSVFKILKGMEGGMDALEKFSPSPRGAADAIVAAFENDASIASLDISGAGFINIHLDKEWAARAITALVFEAPVSRPAKKRRVCVDFSSPNIAKEMHVGHLRSTIIGETICRILEHAGHDVLRINHTGDWGTQFGMLLTHMRDTYPDFIERPPSISDLNTFYKASKVRFDAEPEFNKRAHEEVVALQSGNPSSRAGWQAFCDVSREQYMRVYSRLDIVTEECGESFYNDIIPGVVSELKAKGLLEVQDGATIAWVKDAINYPLFLQKSDGGYGYDSTDSAAIWYRTQKLNADWLIYVTDLGQESHFRGIFSLARKAGWLGEAGADGSSRVDHVGFGVVQGKDGKRFKTRSGETVRLVDLLDEAKNRVTKILEDRVSKGETYIHADEVDECSGAIGYGAVKYADLSSNRQKDYKFDYDAMLNLTGDTAVYLLYAHARLVSIIRKSGQDPRQIVLAGQGKCLVPVEEKEEWQLVKHLLMFPQVMDEILIDLMPHRLCQYLLELSTLVNSFSRECRVLKSEKQSQRILLCEAVAVTMRTAFTLLGIQPLMRL